MRDMHARTERVMAGRSNLDVKSRCSDRNGFSVTDPLDSVLLSIVKLECFRTLLINLHSQVKSFVIVYA